MRLRKQFGMRLRYLGVRVWIGVFVYFFLCPFGFGVFDGFVKTRAVVLMTCTCVLISCLGLE